MCPVILGIIVWVTHVRQEMLTLSGTPDFTPFWGSSLYICIAEFVGLGTYMYM